MNTITATSQTLFTPTGRPSICPTAILRTANIQMVSIQMASMIRHVHHTVPLHPPTHRRIVNKSSLSPLSPSLAPPWSLATRRVVSRPSKPLFSIFIAFHVYLASTRSWTPLKVVGDGSFGTVWLCDWHSTLPPNTPLSPMQCGAGARAEWSGKRLVAVKRMKKKWEGGWDECRKLKELEVRPSYFPFSLISSHPFSLCVQSQSIPISSLFTTLFFFQIPRSYTLSLRVWRAICTS